MKKSSSSKRPVRTRDHLMVKLINGSTKAGVQKDQRKEQNRTQCRKRVEVKPEEQ